MCDGDGDSSERSGEHTPIGVAAERARGSVVPPPVGQLQPHLEQLRELERTHEEERRQLEQLLAALRQEPGDRGDGGAAWRRARHVNRRICNDDGNEPPPPFTRASKNVAAAAILLRSMPEPSTSEGRQAHG